MKYLQMNNSNSKLRGRDLLFSSKKGYPKRKYILKANAREVGY